MKQQLSLQEVIEGIEKDKMYFLNHEDLDVVVPEAEERFVYKLIATFNPIRIFYEMYTRYSTGGGTWER